MSYRLASTSVAVLAFSLFVALLALPDVLFWLFGVNGNDLADFMGRRAGVLFLGIGTLMYLGRNAADSELRRAVAAMVCVMMGAMAILGAVEFFRGYAGIGIWLAILVEAAIAIIFARFWRR